MAKPRHLDQVLYKHFDRLERFNRKYEQDIIDSGRFTYIGTENNYRLYKEKTTRRIVRILTFKTLSLPTRLNT